MTQQTGVGICLTLRARLLTLNKVKTKKATAALK